MLKPKSPFYIKPRWDISLFSWLSQFRKSCSRQRMISGARVLQELGSASLKLYDSLMIDEDLACHYNKNGWLVVFKTKAGFRKGKEQASLLQSFGIQVEILSLNEALRKEPLLKPEIYGAVFFPDDAHLDPAVFLQELNLVLQAKGVTLHEQMEVLPLDICKGSISTVHTSQGNFYPKTVVLTAGVWTPGLVKNLGLSIPIQPAKGYCITLNNPQACPQTPLYFGEAKVAVTPLKDALRFSGTLELSGMDPTINSRRAGAIASAARDGLREDFDLSVSEILSGLRSCTPDGSPIIDRCPGCDNLIIAAGHGMMGMTFAPVTGSLIAQMVSGQSVDIDLSLFAMNRFE
jgi:D-amino-acid dehydrogenase